MGTFTPATTYNPYAMLLPDARSTPDEAQRRAAGALQLVLESDTPATESGYGTGWGADRYQQTNHYRGVVAIAIQAYLDALSACKFTLLRKKSKTLTKSASGGGNYARDDEYEPVGPDEHPLARVLEQPGGESGPWSIHQECTYLTLQYLLTGDAPVWTPCNRDGKPVRFFALTSALVHAQFGAGQNPQYPKGAYRVTPYGGSGFFAAGRLGSYALLPGEEVARLRAPHPWSRALGMSPLQVGDREIDCLEAITQSRWAMFDHGVQLDAALMLPGMSEDEGKVVRQSIENKHGGARNARRFLVLSGAGMDAKWDLKTFGQSAREMDYGTSYDQAAGVALSLFRVPKGVVNFDANINYSGLWASRQAFHELTISPYCRGRLSVFLTQALARPWESEPGELKIEVEPQEPKNKEEDDKRRDAALNSGGIDLNEWRVGAGFKPKPDGDVPLPIYMEKLKQAVAPPAMPGAPGDPVGAPGQLDPNAPPGAEGEQDAANPGEAQVDAEDTPEATQDAVANAALAALGVPAEGEEQAEGEAAPLAKAVTPRAEGEKWQVGTQWYVKRGGKAVKTAAPGTATQRVTKPGAGPQAKPAAKGDAAGDIAAFGAGAAGAINDNYYAAVKDSLAKTGDVPRAERGAGSAVAQAWDRVKAAGLDKHPEAHDRFTAAAREASTTGGGGKAWLGALNKHFAGVSPAPKAGAADDQYRVWNPKDHYSHPMSKGTKALSDRVAGLMGGPGNSPAAQKIKRKMEADGETDLLLTPQVIAELSKGAYPKGDYSDLAGHTVRLNVGPNKVGDRVGRTGQVTHVIPPKPGGGAPAAASPAGATPSPGAHPHDALAAKLLNGRSELKQINTATKPASTHVIRDGASLKAFLDAGGKLPPEHFGEHAKAVPASTPVARKTLLSVKTWARMHADRHADKVAKHFGIPREKAHQLLLHAIVETAKLAAKHGSTRTTGTLNQGGLKLRVNINGRVAPGGGVPKPSNPDAAGSRGAPVVAKALEPREFADPAPYGYCPECREPGVCCERRPNGDATCAAGHTYPRAGAKYASTHVTLTGAAARKLRALAAKVADADLGDDGREADPHVTARYGLHVDSPAPVVEVVRGFGPVAVRLGRLNAFRGAEYDVIYAEVDSPDLHRLNAALGELPHTDTHSVYTPHATVAYVKAGLADKYLATLGAVDEAVTVDSLTFSTAKRARVDVPLAAVVKAASTPDFANGGALVQTGDDLRRRKRVMREVLARRLKALEMQG